MPPCRSSFETGRTRSPARHIDTSPLPPLDERSVAQMAESVDAPASGAGVRMDVEVRVLFWAPFSCFTQSENDRKALQTRGFFVSCVRAERLCDHRTADFATHRDRPRRGTYTLNARARCFRLFDSGVMVECRPLPRRDVRGSILRQVDECRITHRLGLASHSTGRAGTSSSRSIAPVVRREPMAGRLRTCVASLSIAASSGGSPAQAST